MAAVVEVGSCDLCAAEAITERHAETDLAWVADCRTCGTPMVVWRRHGTTPDDADHVDMLHLLDEVASARYPDRRWLVDQRRRSIPGHWHAHARPVDGEEPLEATFRAGLRALARRSRPDPEHGWRAWVVDGDGCLVSRERQVRWPERRQVAECDSARSWWTADGACGAPPGPDCLCGIAFFATLDDAAVLYGYDEPMGQLVWGAIRTEGTVRRDHALLGGTWRCEAAELVALIVPPDVDPVALEERYRVPVHVTGDPSGHALIAVARDAGLPAVDLQPGVDLRLEAAGGAWTTVGLGQHVVSYVPHRDGRAHSFEATPRPGARFTWYTPGEHRLALTAEECDAILASVAPPSPSTTGTVELIDGSEDNAWIWERCRDAFQAANGAWWQLPIAELRHLGVRPYAPGDSMVWHTDNTPLDQTFRLSLVALLTDPADFTGGQLEFLHDEHPTAPPLERGTVVVFPSTLLHRVTPLTSGTRRTLIAFAHAAR